MKQRNRIVLILSFLVTALVALAAEPSSKASRPTSVGAVADSQAVAPQIEIVFCLDATSSMGGLIQTAKEKIWDIVTSLTQASPAPEIKLGMVFYRDRGDAFVTKTYPLTKDIDGTYAELLRIQAEGGGDAPESVNQALHEAVTQMNWSRHQGVYQTIFLVGDCPPHMDYVHDHLYPATCSNAKESHIRINTLKLGSGCEDAIAHFKAIAEATGGEYLQLDQQATDVVIATPFDDSINVYSYRIDHSKIYYGTVSQQSEMMQRQSKSLAFYKEASVSSNSDRASFNMSGSGADNWYGSQELINDLNTGKVKLEAIEHSSLPIALQRLDKKDLQAEIEKTVAQRESDIANMKRLLLAREAFLQQAKKAAGKADSFSEKVFKIIQKQAATQGVVLGRG
jgi:hypothetical protein